MHWYFTRPANVLYMHSCASTPPLSSLLHDEDEDDDDGTLTGYGAATQHPAARTEGEPGPNQADLEMTSLSNTPRNGARQYVT